QNFIKILTLSNYGKITIAQSLANRFNQSFEQHIQSNLSSFKSNSSTPLYRAKDIIQIMNTLIYMGYVRKQNVKYLDLIHTYHQMNQFDKKSERLVDLLAPLAIINCFPENLLQELFTKENLNQLIGKGNFS
ncbi:unnamed protein product, partial [Rotaria sp. Silwood2]